MDRNESSDSPRSNTNEEALQTWCDSIAGLVADALVDGGMVQHSDFKQAAEIISEEIWVRLLINDYPPSPSFAT
jgi:hypothetical protein